MKNVLLYLLIVLMIVLAACNGTPGAIKVASGVNGPWIITADGAIHAYNGSGWDQKEPPGTAEDLEICGTFLLILTKPDAQGNRTLKSRDIYGSTWTTYPPTGQVDIIQVACDGYTPVVTVNTPNKSLLIYNDQNDDWSSIRDGVTEISVINGDMFYLYATTTYGNIWSRNVSGGPYTRWDENMVAHKIAGDANGFPWVATNATSNPLYKWDNTNQKWTFGFPSGPVYDMDIQSYSKMYILSDPKKSGGGYTLYSHDLYSGGWTTYSLP